MWAWIIFGGGWRCQCQGLYSKEGELELITIGIVVVAFALSSGGDQHNYFFHDEC